MRTVLLLMLLWGCVLPSFAQFSLSQAIGATGLQKEASDGIKSVSDKSLSFLQKKYEKLNSSVEKESQKMLARIQKKEDRLKKKVCKEDSLKAVELFSGAHEEYNNLAAKMTASVDTLNPFPLKEYIPEVDSMQMALDFLKTNTISLPQDKIQMASQVGNQLKNLQGKLQKANEIENFVKERERYLKGKLQNVGLTKQLKSINKEVFYFQTRLREYKELLANKEKLEQRLLGIVRKSHLFQNFMKRNSYMASLFPAMADNNTPQSLVGLQTVAGAQQQLQQRFGAGAFSGSSLPANGNPIQQQMQAAQSQLSQLRNRLNQSGVSGGNSDMTMPDFKPNNQHTKTFPRRLEYGINVQSEQSRSLLPATSEVAVTVGYKLNDKSVVGVGSSYRLGWGTIRRIRLSNEGLGFRSYVDIKTKGSFWLSGGFEMNYIQRFNKYQELYNLQAWQQSGLVGLKKKYKVGKKENNIQLLWDFLSYQQIPRTQALKFRLGFNL